MAGRHLFTELRGSVSGSFLVVDDWFPVFAEQGFREKPLGYSINGGCEDKSDNVTWTNLSSPL